MPTLGPLPDVGLLGAGMSLPGAPSDNAAVLRRLPAGLFALQTAATYLQHAPGPVLVVGAETFSKVLPPAHKMALLSLGDGAGALVIGRRRGALLRALFTRITTSNT